MIELDQITGRQIAAARTLLGMPQPALAAAASISIPTLRRMEAAEGAVGGMRNNVAAVIRALEDAGVVFLSSGDTTDGGAGIRLK